MSNAVLAESIKDALGTTTIPIPKAFSPVRRLNPVFTGVCGRQIGVRDGEFRLFANPVVSWKFYPTRVELFILRKAIMNQNTCQP